MKKWLDKYKSKGEVKKQTKSNFNPYTNVNRVGVSESTNVNRNSFEKDKKAKYNASVRQIRALAPPVIKKTPDNYDAPGIVALRKHYRDVENNKKILRSIVKGADVITDIMQLGNFSPEPIGQTIGKIGNIAGMGVDAFQVGMDLREGNYGNAAINAASVILPTALDSKSFRRNSKYLQPGQTLYPLSPQANLPANATMSMRINPPQVNYIEPFTKVKGMTNSSLYANRGLLGALGAETIIDLKQNGGLVSKNSLNRKVTCSNCGWSWKLSDGGEDPLTCHKCGGTIKMKHGGELDIYKDKGEVVNPNNPIQLPNVNFVYKRPVAKSTFNPYENVNRVSSSDGTRVFRLNPEQVENAKKAAAIRNEKIVKEYLQNQQSFIGPDNRTKAEIDKGIALKKEYDRVIAMQNSDLAKTFASFTPGNNIEAGVMGAETFANLNPIISGPILATSRLAPAIMHPTNNAYWGSGRSNLENGLGVLGAIGDITMISPYLKIPLAGIKNPFKNKNFKSEINWANWNKEIPENVPLMQEYNAIEQTTKANGTWMKNFDGSKFKGTPEQFVQQNSENFKKAYKKGFNTGYRGQRIPTDIMDGGKYPSGITFLGDKDQAMTYGETWKKSHSGKIYQPGMSDPKEPALYELIYPNSNNKKIITHSNVRDWRELTDNDIASQMDEYLLELRGKSKKGEQFITTDDVANFVDKNNLDYAYLPKIRDYGRKPNRRFFNVFPGKSVGNTVVVNSKPGNYLKSRWYNNGMFDMTNPNIYKAVIPTMLGLGALNQKQEGGAIITNRGQWDYPGQTTIIPSNKITMQGVPYPVTGVDNLGNTMVMQPGINYTFPGQYVTEYPMMQYGGQNTDWEIIG